MMVVKNINAAKGVPKVTGYGEFWGNESTFFKELF